MIYPCMNMTLILVNIVRLFYNVLWLSLSYSVCGYAHIPYRVFVQYRTK